ncbi:hypothetical protein Ciccas_010277 [Cichlidogyrus casuarinus]|uniref:Uncharacterized protein n=1 Tax=Cichlidogyrus casuarinus TaxID=1844966 RepID=A0ABD2PUX0_9PLAT
MDKNFKDDEIVSQLLSGADNYGYFPIFYAIKYNYKNILNVTSRFRVNELKPDIDGNTALHLAVVKGSLDCVEILLSKCPKLLMRRNNEYMSPIELAAVCGRLRITKALLKAGAIWFNEDFGTVNFYLSLIDQFQPNSLMYAAFHGQARILQYLLDTVEGIDPNVRIMTAVDPTRMPKGKNALDLAIDEKNK